MDNTLVKIESPQIQTSLTQTGWDLPTKMTESDWKEAGSFLMQVNQARQWWLGDWWNACKWGDGKAACAEVGVDARTAKDCGIVARNFEMARRNALLTFSHHREVCPIEDPATQDQLLDWCLSGTRRKSVRDLREKAQEYLEKKDWEDFDAEIMLDGDNKDKKELTKANKRIEELKIECHRLSVSTNPPPNLDNLIPKLLTLYKGGSLVIARAEQLSTLDHKYQDIYLQEFHSKESHRKEADRAKAKAQESMTKALKAIEEKELALAKLDEAAGTTESDLIFKHDKELTELRKGYLAMLKEEKNKAQREASNLHARLNKEKIEAVYKDKDAAEKAKRQAQEKANAAYKKREELEGDIKRLQEQLEVNNPDNVDLAMAKQLRSSGTVMVSNMKELRLEMLKMGGGMERSVEVVKEIIDVVSLKLSEIKRDIGEIITIE